MPTSFLQCLTNVNYLMQRRNMRDRPAFRVWSKFASRTGILRSHLWLITPEVTVIRLNGYLLASCSLVVNSACMFTVQLLRLTTTPGSIRLSPSPTTLPTIWRRDRTKTPRCLFAVLIIDIHQAARHGVRRLPARALAPTNLSLYRPTSHRAHTMIWSH